MSTQCNTNKEISIQDLEQQLEDAKTSLVDRKYVNYDEQGHLFQYDIDFNRFLNDIQVILEGIKDIPKENNDNYKMA